MHPITIIKLGGSLLTHKDKAYSVREGIFQSLASDIAECIKLFPETKFILLNGAGSFGHQTVKKYNLQNGFSSDESKFGYAKVLQDTAKLNRILVDALVKKEVSALSFQPSTVFYSDQNGYSFSSLKLLQDYLNQGFLPCLYGELVLDLVTGCKVLSADKIPELLVNFFWQNTDYKVTKVINLGSYDGVLNSQNEIIPMIARQNYSEVKKHLYQSTNIDVSGGMQAKIEEFLTLADMGVDSAIISGLVPRNLQKYLLGAENLVKTEIKKI